MTELHKHQEPSQTAETRHKLYRVLPAVFTVNTYWGSGKLTHLGTNDKMPLCGSKLQGAELSDTKIKVNEWGEIFEYWHQSSNVQKPKWVNVASHNYCKRCLSVLNGR